MSDPFRMVYVSWEYPPLFGGGIGTYVHAMSRILAARGHAVTVITVGGTAPAREVRDGVTIVRLPTTPGGIGPLADLRLWQLRSLAVAELLGKLARGGIDVIEFADYRGEGVEYLKSTRPGERPLCVLRLHAPLCVLNEFSPGQPRNVLLEQYELEGVRLADRIVCPSQVLADHVRRHLSRPDLPVDLSPYPADSAFLSAAAGCAAAASEEVLFVGRYQELKGAGTLAQAAAAFLSACPGARLTMIGGDTDRRPGESMKGIVRALIPRGLAERAALLDRMPREQLAERYAAARVCVFPSHFENFPNTCLEAMSLGRPVIGTTQTGMQEIIEDGVSGFLIPPNDVGALAAKLTRVWGMADEELRRIGAAARRRMVERYHPDVVAAEVEELYRLYLTKTCERTKCQAAAREGSAASVQSSGRGCAATSGSDDPAVAIVIPCFNHGRYLADALASVRAQTWRNIECVIVDDGSTEDLTLTAIEDARRNGVRVIRQENEGLAAARNAGIRATNSAFFVPLDSDDRIEPRFVEALVANLLADPALGYAYSTVRFFGAADGAWDCPAYDPRRLLYENLSVATAVVRRRAFDEVGGYSHDMVHGYEDWDFWLALLSAGWRGARVRQPMFWYRKHAAGSMLDESHKQRAEMSRVMIGHHRGLYARLLEDESADAIPGVDQMPMRRALATADCEQRSSSTLDSAIYKRLLAEAELSHIENSRLWRTVKRWRQSVPYRAVARLGLSRAARATEPDNDAITRLHHIKTSTEFRLIQAMKRSALYRWYARRKYGPDFRRQSM